MRIETADFDVNQFTQSGTAEADKALLVKFFMKEREDKEASLKEGRPIFNDVEHIDIKVPGNRGGGACRPATEQDKKRFPDHYRRFKDREEGAREISDGTPLTEWAPISRSMAAELAFFNVFTVEHLANMADVHASRFMGLLPIREKAKLWLENAKKDKPMWEMDQRIRELRADNEELKKTIEGLVEQVQNPDSDLNEAQRKRKLTRTLKEAKAKAE